MSERNTVIRSLHDVGLAAWFGGSLAGAVGINGAAADVRDRNERLRVANAGWGRWSAVNLAAIGAHLVGGAALGATAWSGALGKKLAEYDGVPVEGATEPAPDTPAEVAKAQQQLKVLQWVIPALTGGIVVLTSVHGEQQRPGQQLPGILHKPAQLIGVAS